jgi:hypothetical protein
MMDRSQNPDVVRVAPGTGFHRAEGHRRASRNGPVSDLPPEIPTRKSRLHDCKFYTASQHQPSAWGAAEHR